MIGKYLGIFRSNNFTSYDVDKQKFYEWINRNKR